MGVVIKKLYRMDGYPDRHFGIVTHNESTCEAVLVGSFDGLQQLLNTDATAEYELNEIISVDANLPADDSLSGIFPSSDQRIVIDGTVHNETKIDEHVSVMDICILNGSDFFAVTTEELGLHPTIGTRIRIVGQGLHVYPTFP
jgi:hypothetical protein